MGEGGLLFDNHPASSTTFPILLCRPQARLPRGQSQRGVTRVPDPELALCRSDTRPPAAHRSLTTPPAGEQADSPSDPGPISATRSHSLSLPTPFLALLLLPVEGRPCGRTSDTSDLWSEPSPHPPPLPPTAGSLPPSGARIWNSLSGWNRFLSGASAGAPRAVAPWRRGSVSSWRLSPSPGHGAPHPRGRVRGASSPTQALAMLTVTCVGQLRTEPAQPRLVRGHLSTLAWSGGTACSGGWGGRGI